MLPLHLCCCLLLPYFHNGYDYGSCTYTDVAIYSSPGHFYADSLQCCHLLLFQLSPAHTPLTQTSILQPCSFWQQVSLEPQPVGYPCVHTRCGQPGENRNKGKLARTVDNIKKPPSARFKMQLTKLLMCYDSCLFFIT